MTEHASIPEQRFYDAEDRLKAEAAGEVVDLYLQLGAPLSAIADKINIPLHMVRSARDRRYKYLAEWHALRDGANR